MTTVLTGTGTDGIGQDVDGSGDFGRSSDLTFAVDGYSDLLVGTANSNRAFVYFGSATGYAATPSITITGTAATDFGSSVVNAGDLDGDGLADIAVAAAQRWCRRQDLRVQSEGADSRQLGHHRPVARHVDASAGELRDHRGRHVCGRGRFDPTRRARAARQPSTERGPTTWRWG
jgi:hypothetical protein